MTTIIKRLDTIVSANAIALGGNCLIVSATGDGDTLCSNPILLARESKAGDDYAEFDFLVDRSYWPPWAGIGPAISAKKMVARGFAAGLPEGITGVKIHGVGDGVLTQPIDVLAKGSENVAQLGATAALKLGGTESEPFGKILLVAASGFVNPCDETVHIALKAVVFNADVEVRFKPLIGPLNELSLEAAVVECEGTILIPEERTFTASMPTNGEAYKEISISYGGQYITGPVYYGGLCPPKK